MVWCESCCVAFVWMGKIIMGKETWETWSDFVLMNFISMQGDLRRMWHEPFLPAVAPKHLEV